MPGENAERSTENWGTALRYIAGRKAAEESLGFLAHISATIRDTDAIGDVGPAVARTCVPFLASALALDLPATHTEPVVRGAEALLPAVDEIRAVARESGQRVVVSTHEGFADQTDPDHRERLASWEVESAAVLPLRFRGIDGGWLVLVRKAAHRRGAISPGDLALMTEVADRVAAFNGFARLAVREAR